MHRVRSFVSKFREVFPNFAIENIINDLEACVEDFGVKVYYSDMSAFEKPSIISGYSRVNLDGKPEIIVNGNDSESRRRFTIAHELGHIVLHWKWLNKDEQRLEHDLEEVLFRRKDMLSSLRERQANEFAAELLAPLELVSESVKGYEDKNILEQMAIVEKIARVFKISSQFAKIQVEKALKGG